MTHPFRNIHEYRSRLHLPVRGFRYRGYMAHQLRKHARALPGHRFRHIRSDVTTSRVRRLKRFRRQVGGDF